MNPVLYPLSIGYETTMKDLVMIFLVVRSSISLLLPGSRLWLMAAFVLSFASLVAATWVLFSDYVLLTGDHPVWPGVALFLTNFIIFASSCVYKFGRTEEMWG